MTTDADSPASTRAAAANATLQLTGSGLTGPRKGPLNEYITHSGTAVFACPPGLPEADSTLYWGWTPFD